MRKLSKKLRNWLIKKARAGSLGGRSLHLRRRRRVKHLVQLWTGTQVREAVARNDPVIPPANLCLESNAEETLRFLNGARYRKPGQFTGRPGEKMSWLHERQRGLPILWSYSDYSKIEHLSTSAAVVLTAEYDRLRHLYDASPPTVNLHQWSDAVFSKLYEIGFFEILGLTSRVADMYRDSGNVRVMRIMSGTNTEGLESAARNLLGLASHYMADRLISEEVILALNSALSEAMANVARHAYSDDHVFPYKHIGKWWVTAEVDRLKGTLTVVIYDQGATIPVTFPKRSLSDRVQDYLSRTLSGQKRFEFENDATYVAGAMIPGNTQTGLKYRGYGIPQMKELIDICGSGKLTIFSRGGRCQYECGGEVERRSYAKSIGGTLIEWVVQLPEREHVGH